MAPVDIIEKEVILLLTTAKGAIRIADKNGNHFSSPTKATNVAVNSVEWMITNGEIGSIIPNFCKKTDIIALIGDIKRMKNFIWDSKFATREAIRITNEKIADFEGFNVYKYTETFYSFEKTLDSGIKVRITFKMGDFTLAPHMFVLIPFNHKSIEIKNSKGIVNENQVLGSKCEAYWNPDKKDIIELTKALCYASKDHADDIIDVLNECMRG